MYIPACEHNINASGEAGNPRNQRVLRALVLLNEAFRNVFTVDCKIGINVRLTLFSYSCRQM